MKKLEITEDVLRKFFEGGIDELTEDEKLLLHRVLIAYLTTPRGKGTSTWIHRAESWPVIYETTGFRSKPTKPISKDLWFEEKATRQYTWPMPTVHAAPQNIEKETLNKLIDINNDIRSISKNFENSKIEQNEAVASLGLRIDELLFKASSISAELHERLIPESFGIELSDYPVSRFIPIKVYLSEYPDRHITEIISSVGAFIDSLGFLFVDEFPSQRGSWWKSWFGKSKEVMTSDEFSERLKKGERAIELATLDKVQSEVNKNNAEAASNLIGSLDSVDNAAIQIGSLLLVKVTNGSNSSIHTKQLTNNEMVVLEKNQSLLHQPTDIIEKLEKLSCRNLA